MEGSSQPGPETSQETRAEASDPPPGGRPILFRLLIAFVLLSFIPVGIFALLSFREAQVATPPNESEEAAHTEGAGKDAHTEGAVAERPHGPETLLGVPIYTIELGVAGASVVLGVLMALYISRTLLRPIRQLQSSMRRVEAGDLETRAPVRSNDELGQLANSFNRMVEGVKREAFIRDLFGQYVTPELAKVAIEHEGRLGGQLVTSTILFSDIRDFTGVSEALPASSLIDMLNRYFDRMSSLIVANGGLVNKFGGDSLLAVFGTPLNPHPDHAAQAVRAALAMEEALVEFNKEQAAAYLPELMIGVGIATGDVVAGNLGSEKKLEYTVIGDAVNVASRLQTMTRELSRPILANAETARAASAEAEFVDVGEVEVRGRTKKTRVLAVEPRRS